MVVDVCLFTCKRKYSMCTSVCLNIPNFVFCVYRLHDFLKYYFSMSLRKHAYSNIVKILPPKNENFQIKNSYIF